MVTCLGEYTNKLIKDRERERLRRELETKKRYRNETERKKPEFVTVCVSIILGILKRNEKLRLCWG